MPTKLMSCLIAMALCPSLPAQDFGSVKGRVVDENGKPIPRASVHLAENKTFMGHRVIQMHETDEDGRFLINHVEWGSYSVLAGKEDAGYPDTKLAFYSNLNVPTVTLAPSFPSADVKIQLGPKAGIFEIESVRDALTGKNLDSATITLRRVRNSEFFIATSASGQPRLLVPALTEVSVEISAPGHNSLSTQNQGTIKQLRLKPEEVLKLDVKLYPSSSETK